MCLPVIRVASVARYEAICRGCYRVGDFRLIAKLEDAILTVVIIKTGHRSMIYEDQLS